MAHKSSRIIAFYLPQYHPIPENDRWWGKGFTEWTNVGKAKPLFPGHYQPKVPADLGYYDLRLPEAREAQAQLAVEAGVDGFCYWHYWFEGKRLLEKPFNEVLATGKPDLPFCLCWANHSWYAKRWNKDIADKLLIEQTYKGSSDYEKHFYALLQAFKDKRYMKVNNKPIFGIYDYKAFANVDEFLTVWNNLAIKNGFDGFYFFAIAFKKIEFEAILAKGFNAIIYDMAFLRKKAFRYIYLLLHKLFSIPQIIDYRDYIKTFLNNLPIDNKIIPCIIPNFDHTPRSGRRGTLMINTTPDKWHSFVKELLCKLQLKSNGEDNIVFIKSWNEWAEGNYLEPDLKYGKAYLNALKQAIEESNHSTSISNSGP